MNSRSSFAILAAVLALFTVASNADESPQCSSHKPSTASLFTYEDMGTYQKVEATRCGKKYILYPRGQEAPDLGSSYQYFAVPLSKVAVTQTVVVSFLETIGVRDAIAVSSEYTTSACVAKNIEDGDAEVFIPNRQDATAHALQMGQSEIDAIITSPWGVDSWADQASAFKVICESSTSELDPLGSAEWIKFFGYLFDKKEEAESAFCSVHSRYACNAEAAAALTSEKGVSSAYSTRAPTMLFTSLSWDDSYSIAMPEYKQEFVKDAGGKFPELSAFESFKTDSGYKIPKDQVSKFHEALQLADVLVDETYPHGRTMEMVKASYGLTQPLMVGQTFLAGGSDPAVGSTGWSLTSHGIGEKLFTVDRDGKLVGQLARGVEKSADGSWVLTLEPGRKFSDGAPVTAEAVAWAIGRINDMNSAASASVGKMTLVALDTLRLRITTERPTQVMSPVLAEWPFVVHRDRSSSQMVFTGPYEIDSLRSDSIDLVPNIHHPDADRRAPFTIKKFPDGQSVAQALADGEIDLAFNLPVEAMPSLSLSPGLTVKSFPVGYQYMMWFNTRKPQLSDVRVRQALSLAIDRRELSLALGAGEPATGAFPETSPYGLGEALAEDTVEAARLLDEAGWVLGADGKRSKDGQALEVDVKAYPMRPDLVTMRPLIKASLEALGVTVTESLTQDPSGTATSHDFDLFLWAQHTLPAGDPGFFLNMFFRTGAGNNHAGIASTDIDSALDQLASASSDADRATATNDAHRAVIDEAPVSFLITPVWHVGMSRRMATYEPWGSDYYVIRSDIAVFHDMSASDLPPAIRTDRLYTMDGTMDSRGPPWGGIDWFESRIAEPDSMLADLISVLHRTSSAEPTDLHYLRHVSTGSINVVTAADCADPSAPRPVRAATCDLLADQEPNATPAAVDDNSSSSSSKKSLHIAIGLLGGLTVVFGAVAAYMYTRVKAVPDAAETAEQLGKAANAADQHANNANITFAAPAQTAAVPQPAQSAAQPVPMWPGNMQQQAVWTAAPPV